MITEHAAVALLAATNPVPDLDAYEVAPVEAPPDLATSEQRRSDVTQLETRPRSRQGGQRPPIRWLTAVAVVMVVGVGIALWSQLGDDSPGSTAAAIPLNGAEGDAAAVKAFAAVEAAYAAYNEGDPVWVDIRSRGGGLLPDERDLRIFESEQAADGHIDVAQCSWRGLGEWPDVVDEGLPPAIGHLFACEATRTDAFHEAAGLQLAEFYQWVVADGSVVAAVSSEDTDTWFGFVADFRRWLQETHPDVAAEVTFIRSPDRTIVFFPEAASVPTALKYVDEFVATRS